jgi:hypothetical protein
MAYADAIEPRILFDGKLLKRTSSHGELDSTRMGDLALGACENFPLNWMHVQF